MRAQTLLYVVGLTSGYLPAIFAAPSLDLVARHDHHHDHSHAEDEHLGHIDEMAVAQPSSIATSATPIPSSSSTSSIVASNPHAQAHDHGHGHGHGHGSHHKPQVELNETDVHHWHHFPPSYLAADFRLSKDQVIFGEELDESWTPENEGGHRMMAFGHAATFILAYFGILPIALALRAANHPFHHLVNLVFLAVATFSWLLVLGYRAATPNRYEGSSHAVLVNGLYFLSVGLTVVDWLAIVKRAIQDHRSGEYAGKSWFEVIRHALEAEVTGDDEHWSSRYEMVGFSGSDGIVFSLGEHEEEEEPRRRSLRDTDRSTPSRSSTGSEGTLHEAPLYEEIPLSHQKPALRMGMGAYDIPSTEDTGREHDDHEEPETWRIEQPNSKSRLGRLGEVILTWIRRTQVVIAYVTVLSGFIVYTGMCRASFLPSCLAHYIKGSIFFGYGVLTFARYLGAYADLGWAWNRKPAGKTGPTAEMVECTVIFVYGITQTWMERIGSHSGDPYTVKQVQHISIAVMFWFAGLGGMLLESKRMRKVMSNISGRGSSTQVEPASYSFSFNPLPALVIAVTGLAMAAHHQNYVFQVEIHSLWGILLAGGSIFRMLTYFFLFLRPPVESELPSRPPTEILTSFGWAAGGIVFMLSNEEITFAAMRTGYDDMMAFLNFTVALTCAVFCWEVVVMGVKGWAVGRMNQRVEGHAVRV